MAKSSFFSTSGLTPTTTTAIESALATINSQSAATLTALDNFTDIYLGNFASNPTSDLDGDALQSGMLYFNTTDNELKVYKSSVWGPITPSGSLQATNNLSDVASQTQSRKNLLLESSNSSFSLKAENATGDAVKVNGAVSGSSYKRGSTVFLDNTGALLNVTIDAGNF